VLKKTPSHAAVPLRRRKRRRRRMRRKVEQQRRSSGVQPVTGRVGKNPGLKKTSLVVFFWGGGFIYI
jgi:hypothetical protein